MPQPELSRLKIDRSQLRSDVPGARRWIGYTLAFAAGLFIGAVTFSREHQEPERPAVETNTQVQAETPTPPPQQVLTGTGYVVAQRQASVSSKATGRLKELRVREGDTVKAGDVLGILENADLEAQVREQEANIGLATARIKSIQAELQEAKSRLQRIQQAVASGAVSQAERDQAAARFDKLQSDLVAQRAAEQLARAQLERVRVELSYAEIVAPFDGTVLTKDADVGEIVAPFGSSTNARAAVVTIADMSSLEVEADISEANIAKVQVGQKCEITLDSFPEKKYRGIVSKIVPTVDRAKGTVLSKIRFEERDEKVLPEMSARVTFVLE